MHVVLGRWRLRHLSRETLAVSHFALRRALRDHGRSATRLFTEEDMEACERSYYAARRGVPVAAGPHA
jgi:hypothetical protein